MALRVELVSQEKRVFAEEAVDMVLIPAVEGTIGVLPNHAPGADDLVRRRAHHP